MSLVNDLLRDLDAQQRRPEHGGDALPGPGTLVKPARPAWVPAVVTATVILVVGAITFAFWPAAEERGDTAPTPATVDPAGPVNEVELAQMQARLAEIEAQVAQAFEVNFHTEALAATIESDALQRVTEQVADLLPETEEPENAVAEPVQEVPPVAQQPEPAPEPEQATAPESVSIAPTRETRDRQQARAVYDQAQTLVETGRAPQALELLEAHLATAEGDEAYRALTAGLQFQQGDYAAAANQYRRLLSDFGEEPVYWLGLALALDQQDQQASALEAYRRARAGEQRPSVVAYIEQQIVALTRARAVDAPTNPGGE
ncbi:tetratricopeptide repeat protein [Marinimicrobium alkaliphilum]|uniref:tetratricopeptide repeat protein n=1 Tax=Marinimicrobium alkaliphilum TaxID=2202654 RepID=UPI000DBA3BF2|nr:tetratricopeptide repeat protein [Marinimicrobium alkaliphilum]